MEYIGRRALVGLAGDRDRFTIDGFDFVEHLDDLHDAYVMWNAGENDGREAKQSVESKVDCRRAVGKELTISDQFIMYILYLFHLMIKFDSLRSVVDYTYLFLFENDYCDLFTNVFFDYLTFGRCYAS